MRIGQFRLIEQIGQGGTSCVWRGEHIVQSTPVAIKIMNREWIQKEGFAAFQHEVQTMARLSHPGIVRIFDSNVVSTQVEQESNHILFAGDPCVMMEFAQHGTLHSIRESLDWDGLKFVVRSILSSLSHAHARNVLHSDLKPGNILVTKHQNRTLARMTKKRPLLLFIDDAQWGEEPVAFAEYLREERDVPVMVIATIREDALAREPKFSDLFDTSVWLKALDADEHRRLVEELLPLLSDLVTAISNRTAGNPLFAVQLIEDWVQRGVLEYSDTGFALQRGSVLRLPKSIHQVWDARFEELNENFPNASAPLFVGAILGLEVDDQEWKWVCEKLDLVIPDELLSYLAKSRLISDVDGGWAFTHSMLREAILENGSPTHSSAEVHRAAARVLVKVKNEEPSHRLRIAQHFIDGERPKDAVEH